MNCGDVPWSDLAKRNPLFCLTDDIESPDNFGYRGVARPRQPVAAANGPLLPDTSGQKWHYFTQVESPRPNTLRIRHRFPAGADTVFIAMRPPYTPAYHEHLMERLRKDSRHEKLFVVHEVGESWQGRPLHVVQIGGIEAAQARRFPCIVLYAREHGSEDDASWPLIGAIDYLLGSSREAVTLRRQTTFLIIPLLDPDAAAHNVYGGNVIYSFRINTSSKESRAFGDFFREWANDGKRLDLAFNVHNIEYSSGPHLYPALFEPASRRRDDSVAINSLFLESAARAGYTVRRTPDDERISNSRLVGFLMHSYGTKQIAYEVNSQNVRRKLSIEELGLLGVLMVRSGVEYLGTPRGRELVRGIDVVRRERQRLVDRYRPIPHVTHRDGLSYEHSLKTLPHVEQWAVDNLEEPPPWLARFYDEGHAEPPPKSQPNS